jgi:hypothetical protein
LRAQALETLKQLGAGAAPAIDALLASPDADLRLLAVDVTRAWPSALATPRLVRILAEDQHINVCAAAAEAASERGGAELLAPLRRLRQRFADHPFIAFAAGFALARVQSAQAEPA